MKIRCILIIKLWFLANVLCFAKDITISPQNWWTGMNNQEVIVIAENVPSDIQDITISPAHIQLTKHYKATNGHFHILELSIPADVTPHVANITFRPKRGKAATLPFRIEQRKERAVTSSLSPQDVIYQVIPDRFCNGNEKNDNINNYFEKKDRLNPTGIHGGDLEGLISKIDYVSDLGFTAIELMPVLESNLMLNSYKRLAPTNYYKIDERLGHLRFYKDLLDSCKTHQIKCIQTFVLNQVGNQHPFFKEMIDSTFFYSEAFGFDSDFPNLNVLTDLYSPPKTQDKNRRLVEYSNFPTLNQTNPLVRKLIIQHCLWWVETTGLQYIKIEQAARNHPTLIQELYQNLKQDFPDLNIVLDTHSYSDQNIYWEPITQELGTFIYNYNYAKILANAFSPFQEASKGLQSIYAYTTSHSPAQSQSSIIMLDNHTLNRAFTNADSDISQLNMMLAHLLTSPGIPSIYYGTEWMIKGMQGKGLSNLSKDFPGGWQDDASNGFLAEGMTNEQLNFHETFKKLLTWRKAHASLFNGQFYHFYPESNIYVYSRTDDEDAILVVVNNSSNNDYRIKADAYADILSQYRWCVDIITNDSYKSFNDVNVPPKSIAILNLKK